MDAQAWVVGPTGDFKTLRAALMSGKVRSGATLLLQAATYLEVDLPHNGRTHITIKRHPDATERPIIDGRNRHAVAINARDGWAIEDVVIRNFKGGSTRDAALQGDYPNGSHFTVRNVLLIDVNRGIQQIAGRASADRAVVDRVLVSTPTEWAVLLGPRVDAKDLLVLRPGPPEAVRVGADSTVTDALLVGVRASPGVPVAGIVLANTADASVRGAVVTADPTTPGAVGIVTSALAGHESNVVIGAFTAVGIGTWAGEEARRPSERVTQAGPAAVDVEAMLRRMMRSVFLPRVASVRQHLMRETLQGADAGEAGREPIRKVLAAKAGPLSPSEPWEPTGKPLEPTSVPCTSIPLTYLEDLMGKMDGCSESDFEFTKPAAGKEGLSFYNVVTAGASPVEGGDAGAIINKTIQDALADGVGAVFIPAGVYTIDTPIQVTLLPHQQLRLFGDYPVLRAGASLGKGQPSAGQPVMRVTSARTLSVEGLVIDCNDWATVGVTVTGLEGRTCVFRRLSVARSMGNGIEVTACRGAVFRDCTSHCNSGDAWVIRGADGCHFASCAGRQNDGAGFRLSGYKTMSPEGEQLVYPGGCFLTCALSEWNDSYGIVTEVPPNMSATEVGGFVIRDGWLEINLDHGVFVRTRNTTVSGLRILAPGTDAMDAATRGIAVAPGVKNVLIIGNHISQQSGSSYDKLGVTEGVDWSANFGFNMEASSLLEPEVKP